MKATYTLKINNIKKDRVGLSYIPSTVAFTFCCLFTHYSFAAVQIDCIQTGPVVNLSGENNLSTCILTAQGDTARLTVRIPS